MKNLKSTISMMLSNDFKDRAKAEYHQLKIRCEKLEDMCKKYAAGELNFTPNCSLELLQEQLDYMLKYKGVLEQRAKIEEIDLEDNEISKGEGIWALVTIGDEKCSMEGNSEKLLQVFLEGLEIKFGKSEEISKSFECDKNCTDCCNDGSPKE